MTSSCLAEHLGGLRMEGGVRPQRTVPEVFEPMTLSASGRQRQYGILAVERLDRGLLINAEPRRVLRKVEVCDPGSPSSMGCTRTSRAGLIAPDAKSGEPLKPLQRYPLACREQTRHPVDQLSSCCSHNLPFPAKKGSQDFLNKSMSTGRHHVAYLLGGFTRSDRRPHRATAPPSNPASRARRAAEAKDSMTSRTSSHRHDLGSITSVNQNRSGAEASGFRSCLCAAASRVLYVNRVDFDPIDLFEHMCSNEYIKRPI